ncbi:hypothetical protein FQA47_025382 [Oryzias melastigma]|uniref:Uncharacterized protein n=1 Tax=Oryzias melastigma TaxID=30732 RepID=A0A834BUW4_ORYME|nr:hypothetical protein FQA47_025382 [Oryzias melastigma]
MTPPQRTRLIETLRHHADSLQTRPDHPDAAPAESLCKWDNSSFQPPSCSPPCHDYLSPPTSPWFPHSFPTFPSFACCFPSPPNLSPPSSNTFSFSPAFPHTSPLGLHVPLLTSLRHPPSLPHREGARAKMFEHVEALVLRRQRRQRHPVEISYKSGEE